MEIIPEVEAKFEGTSETKQELISEEKKVKKNAPIPIPRSINYMNYFNEKYKNYEELKIFSDEFRGLYDNDKSLIYNILKFISIVQYEKYDMFKYLRDGEETIIDLEKKKEFLDDLNNIGIFSKPVKDLIDHLKINNILKDVKNQVPEDFKINFTDMVAKGSTILIGPLINKDNYEDVKNFYMKEIEETKKLIKQDIKLMEEEKKFEKRAGPMIKELKYEQELTLKDKNYQIKILQDLNNSLEKKQSELNITIKDLSIEKIAQIEKKEEEIKEKEEKIKEKEKEIKEKIEEKEEVLKEKTKLEVRVGELQSEINTNEKYNKFLKILTAIGVILGASIPLVTLMHDIISDLISASKKSPSNKSKEMILGLAEKYLNSDLLKNDQSPQKAYYQNQIDKLNSFIKTKKN